MLVREQVEGAIALQARGYQLLLWLEKALEDGFIVAEAAHSFTTMHEAAQVWIERHYLNIPPNARPDKQDLGPFSQLFATYLLNTFDLDENPGKRLYSPDAHCFCPKCSWMVKVPHLQPKHVSHSDKAIADRLRRAFVRGLSVELGVPASDELVASLLQAPELRETVGLCTYASDLLQRLQGVAVGAASLALWRSFAWTAQGSPKRGFKLTADAIMGAQSLLLQRLTASAEVSTS